MLLLLPLGCSFGLSSVGHEDVASSETRIDSIDPAFGSPNGGTEVTIEGAGFVGDVTVTFGGVFGTVTVVNGGELSVVTPSLGAELVVDVVVTSDNGTDTLAGGYSFQRGGSGGDSGGGGDDSGGPDTDTDTSVAGMVGGYGILELVDHACPTCFGLEWGAPPTVTGTAMFHAPADGSWWSWLPAEGACLTGVSPNVLATTSWDAGTAVILNDGARDVTLTGATGTGGVTYTSTGLSSTDYSAATWAVAASGGADIGRFVSTGALRTPADFTSIEPTSLLTETSTSAFQTPFGGSAGTAITWSPSGVGDFVLIILEASNASGALGTTTCRTPDDGAFVVPGSAVGSWPVSSLLAVRFQRYLVTESVLPDGSTFEAVGRAERIGTGAVSN